MLVNTNVPLVTMNGQIMKDNDGNGNVIDATLKMAIVNAILSPVQNEKGVDKIRKYELAKRIYSTDEVDLNVDEIKLIEERVGENYPPLVVGQIHDLLKV